MGLSENRLYSQWNSHLIIFNRDNDHENHWVKRGCLDFQTHPYINIEMSQPAMHVSPEAVEGIGRPAIVAVVQPHRWLGVENSCWFPRFPRDGASHPSKDGVLGFGSKTKQPQVREIPSGPCTSSVIFLWISEAIGMSQLWQLVAVMNHYLTKWILRENRQETSVFTMKHIQFDPDNHPFLETSFFQALSDRVVMLPEGTCSYPPILWLQGSSD